MTISSIPLFKRCNKSYLENAWPVLLIHPAWSRNKWNDLRSRSFSYGMKVTILKENYDPLYPLVIDITLAMKTCSLHRLLKKRWFTYQQWLVGGFNMFQPLWKIWKSVGSIIPNIWKKPPSRWCFFGLLRWITIGYVCWQRHWFLIEAPDQK